MPKIKGVPHKWVVDKQPTGLAAVAYKRRWPSLETSDGNIVGFITGAEDYTPALSRRDDLELTVTIYDWNPPHGQDRRVLKSKVKYATLAAAKAALVRLVELYPQFAYNPRKYIGLTK
mgnify:CR=1 FL=1